MSQRAGIFPTFFLSGFECSTFIWKEEGRRDLCGETQHLGHAGEDYRMLRSLGIAAAREGIPWPLVDKGGGVYDFSYIDPSSAAFATASWAGRPRSSISSASTIAASARWNIARRARMLRSSPATRESVPCAT
jgi:hypothetical protein